MTDAEVVEWFGAPDPTPQVHPKVDSYRWAIEKAKIPPRFKEAHLSTNCQVYDNLDGKQAAYGRAKALAKDEAEKGGVSCLLLAGDFGSGKTWLATAVFKELIWKRPARTATWAKWYDVVRAVQATYSDNETSAHSVLRSYQTVDVLLLDDMGGFERGQTDDQRQLLYELIDYRCDYLLPTIITTNLDQKGLIDQFGERVFNRLLQMCEFSRMTGANLREKPELVQISN